MDKGVKNNTLRNAGVSKIATNIFDWSETNGSTTRADPSDKLKKNIYESWYIYWLFQLV